MAVAPQPVDMPTDDPMLEEAAPETEVPAGPQVICTICKTADGAYQVIAGDEPEGGAAPDDMGGEPEASGEIYDSIGAALKGVMDILQADQEAEGGSQQQFEVGFGGGASSEAA